MVQLITEGKVFVVGLGIGPVLGLLFGDWAFRSESINTRLALAALIIVGAVVLFIPVINTELKIGLLAGVPLGVLLAATPMWSDRSRDETVSEQ
jgi:quinol-cytochrome oxidoreductase complex cytochrome b subunit